MKPLVMRKGFTMKFGATKKDVACYKPKKIKVVVPSENAEQEAFVKWMRTAHPEHRVFAIPNGGSRNIVEAVNLKKSGVSAGVPDLCFPSLHLYIEMKRTKGGTVSPEQKDWIEYLRKHGYSAEVACGFDEAKKIVERVLAVY